MVQQFSSIQPEQLKQLAGRDRSCLYEEELHSNIDEYNSDYTQCNTGKRGLDNVSKLNCVRTEGEAKAKLVSQVAQNNS